MSKTQIIHWLDDYLGDPVLLQMDEEQIKTAGKLFDEGQKAVDMSELDKYLKTMPAMENGWICSDMFDGAHAFFPLDTNGDTE